VGLLLALGWPAAAGAQKRVVVVQFSGPQAKRSRAMLMDNLANRHDVVPAADVDQQQLKLGSSVGCPGDGGVRLAGALKAEAVICGTIRGAPFARSVVLTVHSAEDGARVQQISIRIGRGRLGARAVARIQTRIDGALERTRGGAAVPAADTLQPIPEIVKRLASPAPGDRINAINDLSRHTNWQAMVPMACAMLNDPNVGVRTIAASHAAAIHDVALLTALRSAAELESNDNLRAIIRRTLKGRRQQVDALITQLQNPDVEQRISAARSLSQGAYPQGLDALIRASADPDPRVRLLAVEGLRNYSEPRAQAAIRRGTRDGHPTVRQVAQRFVQERKRLEAWRAFYMSFMKIASKARSRQPEWRAEAVVALGINAAENAAPMIVEILQGDPSQEVRLAAAWTLVLMGTSGARMALQRASHKDHSPRVRAAASTYLAIQQVRIEDQLARLSDPSADVRQQAAETLSLRPTQAVQQHLIRTVMCDPQARVRNSALRGLARMATPLALTTIKLAMFRDASNMVRRTAMMLYVLVGWEDEPEVAPTVVSKETQAWSDAEDPIKAEEKKREAAEKKRKAAEKPARKWCPTGCEALRLGVGVSSLFYRDLGYDNPADPLDRNNISTTPVAGFSVAGEIFPGAFVNESFWANFGLGFRYARYFGLQWNTANTSETKHGVTHQTYAVDFLIFRIQPLRKATVPTLYTRLGLHNMTFSFDESSATAHVPDTSMTSFLVGLGARIPVMSAYMQLGMDFLPSPGWGEITSDDNYGPGSGWGFVAIAAFGGPLGKWMGWRAEVNYTRYMLEFERGLAATRKADGAVDNYIHGSLSLLFRK
jgi:HEAT repeat protein